MDPKFKIGDMVECLHLNEIPGEREIWAIEAGIAAGDLLTISSVDPHGWLRFYYHEYNHHPSRFKLVNAGDSKEKLQVGDRVTVLKVNSFSNYAGEVGTIVEIDSSMTPYRVALDNGETTWFTNRLRKICNTAVKVEQKSIATQEQEEVLLLL